jgi:hypothetical protein
MSSAGPRVPMVPGTGDQSPTGERVRVIPVSQAKRATTVNSVRIFSDIHPVLGPSPVQISLKTPSQGRRPALDHRRDTRDSARKMRDPRHGASRLSASALPQRPGGPSVELTWQPKTAGRQPDPSPRDEDATLGRAPYPAAASDAACTAGRVHTPGPRWAFILLTRGSG